MRHAIVGMFDSAAQATMARNSLCSAGFDAQKITQVSDGQDAAAQDDGGGIGGFFRRLFGTDEHPHVNDYSEALHRGHPVLLVETDSPQEAERAQSIMEGCGALDVEEQAEEWRGQTRSEPASASASQREAVTASQDNQTIPIIEEQLQVGKREVQRGGARIYTRVSEKPAEATVDLREERVIVERRPADRPATEADLSKSQERVFEVRTTAEEAVVAKTPRVVEEVKIGKQTKQRKETVKDTVRKTDIEVQEDVPQDSPYPQHEQGRPDIRPKP